MPNFNTALNHSSFASRLYAITIGFFTPQTKRHSASLEPQMPLSIKSSSPDAIPSPWATPSPQVLAKILQRIDRLEKSYGIRFWGNPKHREDYLHDLTLMFRHQDLRSLVVRLLDRNHQAVFEHPFWFEQNDDIGDLPHPRGDTFPPPVVDPNLIQIGELIVTRRNRRDLYQGQLKLCWTPAPAGRGSRKRAFSPQNREKTPWRTLMIKRLGRKGYAFAVDEDSGQKVFVPTDHYPSGDRFSLGQRLRALVIETPRGLQAREIRAL